MAQGLGARFGATRSSANRRRWRRAAPALLGLALLTATPAAASSCAPVPSPHRKPHAFATVGAAHHPHHRGARRPGARKPPTARHDAAPARLRPALAATGDAADAASAANRDLVCHIRPMPEPSEVMSDPIALASLAPLFEAPSAPLAPFAEGVDAFALADTGVPDPPPRAYGRITGDGVGGLISGGAVPEPSEWMLMIAGFGLAGAALRRRPLSRQVQDQGRQ